MIMKLKKHKNNKYVSIAIYFLVTILLGISLYLSIESIGRSIVLFIMLLVWLGLYHKYNNVWISLLILVAFSFFNITFTPYILDSCYKIGIYVNYLCPTVHITDIFTLLLFIHLLSFLTKELVTKYFKYLFFLLPLLFFTLFYVFNREINSIIYISRLVLSITTVFLFKTIIVEKKFEISKEINYIFIYSLFAYLLIQLIIGFLQFSTGGDLGLQWLGESNLLVSSINSSFISLNGGEYLRAYGTFPHPNIYAGFLIAIYLFISKYLRLKNYELISYIVLISLSLLLTFSRLHILLFLIIVFIQVLYKYREATLKRLGYFSFSPALILDRFNISLSSNTIAERITLMKESIVLIKENLVLGVGGGNFVKYLSNTIRTGSNISLFQPVHNIFLLLIAEYGILGGFYFIFLIFYTLIYRNRLYYIFLSILVMILIGIFEHYLIYIPQGIIVLMMLII